MYHDVTPSGFNSRGRPDNYAVSADQFHSHLDALATTGRSVVSVNEWSRGRCKDAIVLTFDDGWAGTLTHGFPALRPRGWGATLFVTRDFIGQPGFCTIDDLGRAAEAGLDLGVHGCTHRLFETLSDDEIASELGDCREFLLRELGVDAVTASAPGGSWRPSMIPIARSVGLTAVACSRPTVNHRSTNRFDLGRVAIRSNTTTRDIRRYGAFKVGRDALRFHALNVPRTILGPERYAATRRAGLTAMRSLLRRH